MTAYPLTAKAAVHTPIVFRAGLFASEGIPWPSLEGLRDFAHFAGIEDGAVRTALSRAKSDGSIVVETDAQGRNRYAVSPATFAMGTAQVNADQRPQGFLLAVFSFKAEDQEDRSALRNLLKSYGFRKLAQNTYIHGRIDTTGLRTAIAELGLEDHFFLFTCPDIEDGHLISRILRLFDMEGRRKYLREYSTRLRAFLEGNLARDELARRLLYVGPVHWERIEASEPPFPAKYLPPDYALADIQGFYGAKLSEGREALLEYFKAINA
jgi:DNA-binding transcriptional regulator PaaX